MREFYIRSVAALASDLLYALGDGAVQLTIYVTKPTDRLADRLYDVALPTRGRRAKRYSPVVFP